MFEEGGADCSFTLPQEAQSAEGKAGLTGECGHVEAEQAELAKLASELAAEKAKVGQLEGKVAKLNADVERVSQGAEAARIALTTAESQAALECQAELALASGTQFLDSLRALLGRPVPAPSLIECSAAAGGQDPQELAGNRTARADFLCIEELDSEEQALVQCVISRLIEEKKPGANSGRTLCSITTKIFGMSQRELDHLVYRNARIIFSTDRTRRAAMERGMLQDNMMTPVCS